MARQAIARLSRGISSISTSNLEGPKEKADCVVIGAGIVGIAVARALALKGRDVLVLDSASTFGSGISSRNSQVIHAGIYYPPQSLKALFCVKGRNLLYDYCSKLGIPHKRTGKLIVATSSSQIPKLDQLMEIAARNGVDGLRLIEGFEAMRMEPQLQCVKALVSPFSGIVDAHSLMLSLVGEAECHRTTFCYNSTVIGGHVDGNNGLQLHIMGSNDLQHWDGKSLLHPQLTLMPKLVVNSAGLSAVSLARRFFGLNSDAIPSAYFARGCYLTLSNTKTPFQHLIYPIPEDGGLGVHATLDLDGQVKFGPDVEWIDGLDDISSFLDKYDYSVSAHREEVFYQEIRKYYPNLKDGSLELGYAGIRPKISGPGQSPADFVIQGEDVHGAPGLVNLFGIESPGLTSGMAIAEYIAHRFL